METVGPDGEFLDHFDGRTLNPGHAIEAAWFIMREGQIRQDEMLVHIRLEPNARLDVGARLGPNMAGSSISAIDGLAGPGILARHEILVAA